MKKYILIILASLCSLATYAQFKVTGTVYEPSGETCIGATVMEKGKTGNGTATDLDGNFTINVASSKATLVISYIGMQTQEVKLDGQSHVEIHMKDDTATLDEVVIVGYGTQKKINATGAVKTIDNEVLQSRPISNAVQGLQGAVAGLNITNDAGGAPGETMNINIRGVGNIGTGSNSQPLILIDGMEGDLSRINPADIENISVLKDAAAASIYGSRAPFGVILVTTKNGKQGKTTVNYSGNVRFQQPINTPNKPDSYTFALMMNDASNNSGSKGRGDIYKQAQLDKILKYQRGELTDGTEYNENRRIWLQGEEAWGNTDWYDVYLKKVSTSMEHNVSISGGNDKINYYLSGNYLDQSGIFNYADEKYQRFSFNGKLNVTFNKYVNLVWSSRFVTTSNGKPSALNALFFHQLSRISPLIPLYTPMGEYHPDSMVNSMLNGGRRNVGTQALYNQGNLTITPIKDWNIHIDIGSRIENNKTTVQYNPLYFSAPSGEQIPWLVNRGWGGVYIVNRTGIQFSPSEGQAFYEKDLTHVNYFTTNIFTDYSLTLKDKHNFKFLVGVQTESYGNDITYVGSTNIVIPDTPFLSPSKGTDGSTAVAESRGEWSSVGIFGRINYNYEDRYMAEVNLRGDAASRFPKDQRWGVFPSFSVGWNIANEKFWENLYQTWNYFKLRASYGTLGNQNTNSFYPYYQQMSTGPGSLILGDTQATVLPMFSPYSTSLTWEKIENVGAGVDVAFFNNRLNASFDWYQRTTKDMIGPAFALPGVYGADAPNTNNAELRTRGWELELSWKDRIGEVSYSVSASLSDYKTVVTKYDSPDNNIFSWYPNKNYGEIWGYEVVGIAKSDKEMNDYLANVSQTALGTDWGGGDIMYADLNGDGQVNPGSATLDNHGDLKVIGNNTPRYAYSFTLDLSWKWIDFRAYFQGIGKRDYFANYNNYQGAETYFGVNSLGEYQSNLFLDHLDYFRYAGSELGANMDPYYGRLRFDGNNSYISDRFLQDASYLRLKNLQIGFSLPQNWHISKYVKARLYFSAENVFTITKLKIYDPESLSGTADNSGYGGQRGKTYPQYRTYSVGLDLTF